MARRLATATCTLAGASGQVITSKPVLVSDAGSGAQLCFGSGSFGGPPSCSDAVVTGWDWSEPAGGWQVLDPSRTTNETALEVGDVADRLPGFAMRAVSHTDGSPGPRSPDETVVSVYVTEDPLAAEERLREVWSGMLCVAEVEHSEAELERVQQELIGLPGLLEVSAGSLDNQVELTVFHDDGRYQRWVDAEYGEGLVEVTSILQPVE